MGSLRILTGVVVVFLHTVGIDRAQAQRVVKKLTAQCPTGYVNTGQGSCSALGLMTYTLRPKMDKPCARGWSSVGGGYCRRD